MNYVINKVLFGNETHLLVGDEWVGVINHLFSFRMEEHNTNLTNNWCVQNRSHMVVAFIHDTRSLNKQHPIAKNKNITTPAHYHT